MSKSISTKPKKSKLDPDSRRVRDIAVNRFTREECIIIESFLKQFHMVVNSKGNKSELKPDSRRPDPIISIGKANYCKLLYKIENIISPKSL